MKITRKRTPAFFAVAALALCAVPAMARPSDTDYRDYRDTRSLRAGATAQLRDTASLIGLMQALDVIELDRGQKDKIHELVTKYRIKMDDVAHDRRLPPSERDDRIWELKNELRGRVIHVLNQRQKERVFSLERRFVRRSEPDDPYADRYDRNNRVNAFDWLDLLGVWGRGSRR